MDAIERQVRLTLAEESRAEEGMIPCVQHSNRITGLERWKWMFMGAVSLLSFLGSACGVWFSK